MSKIVFKETLIEFWNNIVESDQYATYVVERTKKHMQPTTRGNGVFMEFPSLDTQSQDDVAAFMLVHTTAFENMHASHETFAPVFVTSRDGIVVFPSKGNDGMLVSPNPEHHRGMYNSCLHIAKYMADVPTHQSVDLWQTLARAVVGRYTDPAREGAPVYVSTHGLGVPWLHVRVCDSPKYYVSGIENTI